MSRLAKKPIEIPTGTEVTVSGSSITAKGPLGVLSKAIDPRLSVDIQGDKIFLSLIKPDDKKTKAILGTYISHIKNMIAGVNKLFEKRLIIEGVGFKVDVQGKDLVFNLGFSHTVKATIPPGIKVVSDKNGLGISGLDIEEVGRFAAKIHSLKPSEPYGGKGIHYSDEVVRRKEGKKTV